MNTLTVETANRKRNKYVLLATIGLPLLYLPMVFPDLTATLVPRWVSVPVSLGAVALVLLGALGLFRINRLIKRSPEIHRALRDEIFLVYQRKAFMTGFFSMIILLGILIPVSDYTEFSLAMASRLLFFVGVFSFLVSWLIFNRD